MYKYLDISKSFSLCFFCAVFQIAGFAVFCGAVYTDDRSRSHVKRGPFGALELR